jgi:hypothetical protein
MENNQLIQDNIAKGALLDETRTGLLKIHNSLKNLLGKISGKVLKLSSLKRGIIKITFIATLVQQLTIFVSSSSAMSEETSGRFYTAIKTSEQLQELISKTESLEEGVVRNKNLAKIEGLSDIVKTNIALGIGSMTSDFDKLIAKDMSEEIRGDVIKFEKIARILGDKGLIKHSSELKMYVEDLVKERIIAGKAIDNLKRDSLYGKYGESKEKLFQLFDTCKKYPHLNYYVYREGVIPALTNICKGAITKSSYGKYDEAEEIMDFVNDIVNHETISSLKEFSKKQFVIPLRVSISSQILNNAKNKASSWHFEEAEDLLNKVEKDFKEQKDLIGEATHTIFRHKLNSVKQKITYSQFEEAKELLNEMRKKYSEYGEEIRNENFYLGTKIREHSISLVRSGKYEKAMKFLNKWEKKHFKGKLTDIRKEIIRIIETHARAAYTQEGSEEKIKWAKKFEN